MSFEERNAWGALIAGVITFLIFGRPIWDGTVSGLYAGPAGLSLWAWDVIWLIGGGIAVTIGVVIGFQILYAIASGESRPQFLTDERDTMISRRGGVITLVICSGGFLVAVGLLAAGWQAVAALNAILLGLAVGSFASEFYRIAAYRFGL